jgi:hypothetical protein
MGDQHRISLPLPILAWRNMPPNARSGYWGLPGNWTMKLLIFRWKQRRYAVDLGIANGSPPLSTAASARLCSETGVVLADRQGPAFLLVSQEYGG